MFTNISWQNYWTTLALLMVVYYIIIYLLYFRNNFSFKLPKVFKGNEAANKTEAAEGEGEANVFDSCLNELATFFEEANGRKWIKEELLYALQRIYKKYVSLKNSSYEETIQRLTILQCKDICSVHINAADLNQLWLNL